MSASGAALRHQPINWCDSIRASDDRHAIIIHYIIFCMIMFSIILSISKYFVHLYINISDRLNNDGALFCLYFYIFILPK